MIIKICDICNKKIEGYTENQTKYLLAQHKLTHKFNKNHKEVKHERKIKG
jgi:hypothetical protein